MTQRLIEDVLEYAGGPNFPRSNWCRLVRANTHLIHYYKERGIPLSRLFTESWIKLLTSHPEFIKEKCVPFSAGTWAQIIAKRPELSHHFKSWNKFTCDDWTLLLMFQPQFSEKIRDWGIFRPHNWFNLLCAQPQFIDKCPNLEELELSQWAQLISLYPQLAKYFTKWSELIVAYWVEILKKQPRFAEKHHPFDEITWSHHWVDLLIHQPQFSKYCQNWKDFTINQWVNLITHQPQFYADFQNYYSWEDLDPGQWAKLLSVQPQLEQHCKHWNGWREELYAELLVAQPQFLEKFPNIPEIIGASAKAITTLICKFPHYAVQLDLTKLDRYQWHHLLTQQPSLLAHYLNSNKQDRYFIEDIISKDLTLLNKYNLWSRLNMEVLASSLIYNYEFVTQTFIPQYREQILKALLLNSL